MEFSKTDPWWMTDEYTKDGTVLSSLYDVATVYVNPNGSTQKGWGLVGPENPMTGERDPGFMENYLKKRFSQRITDHRYKRGLPFAYVMRSVPFICVDIDGKNGGFSSTPQLGYLPETLAETSKSGNGYHLFYMVDDRWDDELGYAKYDDSIGIAQGIDIRAVGCVYHHSTQRWNGRSIAPIPDFLAARLGEKKERRDAKRLTVADVEEMDMDDLLVAQHTLTEELNKPIAPGKRNNTLFAIGQKLKTAGVTGWDQLIRDRAIMLGIDDEEADKLVRNIAKY